ncbi:Carboxypeptidase SOL1 [Linum perenne]
MKFLVSLLFFFVLLAALPAAVVGRGGESRGTLSGSENYRSNVANGRVLLEDGKAHKQKLVERARGYMTNLELEKAVKDFGERCSNISRIYSIGKSVNGVPLWVIEISDKPGEEEAEPAFKYIGNVHGDEPVGRELLIRLANWICDNHMKDPLARSIVENIHLHILPSINPDGFALKRRGNAKNIDLNRDFPDQGALVANYPWDGTTDGSKHYYSCPDDDTFRFLASTYSQSHYNMSLSTEFPGGITNGAFWYPIYGAMQDWNYIHAGCFELTLEVSDDKWPSIDEIPTIWEYNRMSLLNLAASVLKTGVHGRIFASDTGTPLPGFITIKGINYTVKASRAFGDYHRLLVPGEKYEVIANVPGYKTKSTTISLGEAATTADFILDPEVTTEHYLQRTYGGCDCGSSKFSLDMFWTLHLEVYVVIIILVLWFLLRRRMKSSLLVDKQAARTLLPA